MNKRAWRSRESVSLVSAPVHTEVGTPQFMDGQRSWKRMDATSPAPRNAGGWIRHESPLMTTRAISIDGGDIE